MNILARLFSMPKQRSTDRIFHDLDAGRIDYATANARVKATWPICRTHRRPCPAVDERGKPFCIECAEEVRGGRR